MVTDTSELADKVAIITGSGRGMGRSVAGRLAAGGARLVVNDIDDESAHATASQINDRGGEALAAPGDVTSSRDVDAIVAAALECYGGVHILVNNAGVLRPTPVVEIEEAEWDFVVNGNLKSTFLCSKAVISHMREVGWGRIVNFSSTAGKNVSTVGGAHYTAAKAGILGFSRHLAKEVAGYGITVNSVCPGLIDTEMVRSTISEQRVKEYAEGFPIPRLGESGEVAELVAFLASDRAAYITGASLDINGGDLMI